MRNNIPHFTLYCSCTMYETHTQKLGQAYMSLVYYLSEVYSAVLERVAIVVLGEAVLSHRILQCVFVRAGVCACVCGILLT